MNLNPRIYGAKCDDENNPPSTLARGVITVQVQVMFEDQRGECFWIEMDVPLAALRSGTLRTVDVRYVT